jgi:RimJ/RimL family protein N-acetyltransferase
MYVFHNSEEDSIVPAYVIFYDSWGNGYGKEAVGAMLQKLNTTYSVSNFRALVNSRNHRSRALIQSLGFAVSEKSQHGEQTSRLESQELEYVLHRSSVVSPLKRSNSRQCNHDPIPSNF